jgi:hypothetical protein
VHLNQGFGNEIPFPLLPNSSVNVGRSHLDHFSQPLFRNFFFFLYNLFFLFHPQELGSSALFRNIALRRISEFCQIETRGKASLKLAL